MQNMEEQVLRTLNRTIDTANLQQRLLMGVAYRDADKAYEVWRELYAKHGFDKAVVRFQNKPRAFGRLKGRLMLGFLKTDDRKNAESARSEFGYHAKRSHLAELQKQELVKQQKKQEVDRRKSGVDQLRQEQNAAATQDKNTNKQKP